MLLYCILLYVTVSQELLALLDHLDKEGKGHVSVDEFVSGLQAMRAVAGVAVTSTPPPFSFSPAPTGRSRRHSDMVRRQTVLIIK